MNYIAVDLSKTSPGISTFDGKKYVSYFFNHRKKLKEFNYKKNNYEIKMIDFTDYKLKESREFQYEVIIEEIAGGNDNY